MNTKRICLAIDLGASNGRAVAGIYNGIHLNLDELNRFSNETVKQFAADALNCPFAAGSVEATSIGNIIMQLYAFGEIDSLPKVVRHSFETKIFEPQNPTLWNDAITASKTF